MPKERVSSKEIDQAVELLQHAFSQGNLTEQEYDERMSQALTAKNSQELALLLRDIEEEEHEVTETLSAICGGFDRNGHLLIPKNLTIKAIMGGCSLDLRQAKFKSQETVIEAIAIMGGIDIVVPWGFKVIVSGSPILGGISQSVDQDYLPSDAPQIRIKARAILGGIDIRMK